MIREVHPGLFVGGVDALADLKRLAGYEPGHVAARCIDCEARIFAPEDEERTHRCLDCANKHIAENWFIIHAAKEPWHRDALGYTGRGAPPSDPEYLVAKRPGEIMLNLVDMAVLKEQYTNPIFEAAFEAIDDAFADGKKVLVHCNEGKSRAPTIALLWLGERVAAWQEFPFDGAVIQFQDDHYPEYDPGAGIEAYARARWGFVETDMIPE